MHPSHTTTITMAASPSSLIILSLTTTLLASLLLPTTTNAQSTPAPGPSGPINITNILERVGQYSTFIRFLNTTQAGVQINNQLNNSHDGMTVFAPTDNAFQNLPSGTLNNLSNQQQVQLILYHICPKYYSISDLQTVSNPVRTQASGQDGRVFGLYFTGQANQVNVSTGVVEVPINNALRRDSPLAVYQVDRVLLPKEFTEAKAPTPSPPTSGGRGRSGDSGADGGEGTAPATSNPAGNGSGEMSMGVGLVSGIWALCMGLLMS